MSWKKQSLASSLAVKKCKKLLRTHKTLVSVESCTGGQLASWLNMLPGSSKSFFGGYVVYTAKAKEDFLGVRTSQPTSMDTAIKLARALPKKDVRVSVVGNLGPSWEPGSSKGTVIACLITEKGERLLVKKLNHNRIKNRWLSTYWLLDALAREVK